jgi:hypothetical protein
LVLDTRYKLDGIKETLWLRLVISTFVWVFGTETFSFKRIKRSWFVSTLVIGIVTGLWIYIRPEQFRALLAKTNDDTTGTYVGLIFTGYMLNLIPDYISSLQTQRTLEFMHNKRTGMRSMLTILIADLIFKTVLFVISYTVFVMGFRCSYHYFKQIRDVWDVGSFSSIQQSLTMFWHTAPRLSAQIPGNPPIGIFYYAVFIPSLWLWGLSGILMMTQALASLDHVRRFTSWFFDVEKHPIKSIGIVAGTTIIFGSLVWSIVQAAI